MARQIERFHPQVPRELDRYLVPTESIIFLIRLHWIVLLEPVLSALGGLFVVGFLDQNLTGGALVLRDAAIVLWVGLVLRALWRWLDWYRELFLATDRRLMLVHGIITRQVDIMPMSKVTDMRYDRTVAGQILGYGTYILESAGQDQALSKVDFVPNPDLHYQQISEVIFAPPQRRAGDAGRSQPSTGSRIPISEPDQAWWRRP